MNRIFNLAAAITLALTLVACGQSKDTLCAEHTRLTKRMAELIVLATANPKNFDEAEFKRVSDELVAVKKKLQDMGSSGSACPT